MIKVNLKPLNCTFFKYILPNIYMSVILKKLFYPPLISKCFAIVVLKNGQSDSLIFSFYHSRLVLKLPLFKRVFVRLLFINW